MRDTRWDRDIRWCEDHPSRRSNVSTVCVNESSACCEHDELGGALVKAVLEMAGERAA